METDPCADLLLCRGDVCLVPSSDQLRSSDAGLQLFRGQSGVAAGGLLAGLMLARCAGKHASGSIKVRSRDRRPEGCPDALQSLVQCLRSRTGAHRSVMPPPAAAAPNVPRDELPHAHSSSAGSVPPVERHCACLAARRGPSESLSTAQHKSSIKVCLPSLHGFCF